MRKLIGLSLVGFLLLFITPAYSTYTWIGGADIWEDAANWDCMCIPGPGDEVIISSGTVDVGASSITVDIVTFTGGTIIAGGGGSLTTTGGFGWTGGTIEGKVFITGSSLDMSGAATKTLKGELHIGAGSLVGWSAGTFLMDGGGLFNSGTFIIESDADIGKGVFLGVIENSGDFKKTMGAGTTHIDAFFHNFDSGKIDLISGTISLNYGLFNEAEIKVDPGTILDITFESLFDPGSALDGTGKIKFSGDSSTYAVPYSGAVEFEFSGGVFMVIAATVETTGPVSILGAEMEGMGELIAKGTASWEAGDIMTDLTFTISPTGSLTISTMGDKNLYGDLDLDGPTSWAGGDIDMYGFSSISNAGLFSTDFNGTINAVSGGGTYINESGGVFDKTGGGGQTVIETDISNAGTIKATADTVKIEDLFTNTGEAYSSASGNISFSGGSSWSGAATMTGTGDMDFLDGANVFSTSISSSNWIGFLGGTSTISAVLTNDNIINLNSPGTLTGAASISSEGLFNFKGGTLDVALTIEAGSDFDIYSSFAKTISETMTIDGICTIFGTVTDLDLDSPGELLNYGTLNLEDGVDIGSTGAPGDLTNYGTLVKNSSSTSTLDIPFSNSGTIKGVGTLDPTISFSNSGIFEPGTSPGILTLDHDFTNGTQINIEILDETGAGTGHDELIVTGAISLEDSLVVVETGSVPVGTYIILSCTGGPSCLSGTFEKTTLPAGYSITYNATNVTVTKSIILPVELFNFAAKPDDQNVMLSWETASERENDYFEIERSIDGLDFRTIGLVDGSGNSFTSRSYEFEDENILKDNFYKTIYYRLKQIDTDGQFEFSDIVALQVEALTETWAIHVYPVSGNHLQVIYNSELNKEARAYIFDTSGKVLLNQKVALEAGNGVIDLYPKTLPGGLYMIQIAAGRFQQTVPVFLGH